MADLGTASPSVLFGQNSRLASKSGGIGESQHSYFPISHSYADSSNNIIFLVLIDSGADDCFLDREFALRVGIPLEPLSNPLTANALDGRLLARVTHHTVPVNLILSGNINEQVRLNIISTPDSPLQVTPGLSYTIPT